MLMKRPKNLRFIAKQVIFKFMIKQYGPPFNYSLQSNKHVVILSDDFPKHNGGSLDMLLWAKKLKENGIRVNIVTKNSPSTTWLENPNLLTPQEKSEIFRDESFLENLDYHDTSIVIFWLKTSLITKLPKAKQVFFYDMEIAWSIEFIRDLERLLKQRKIARIATHSSHSQIWYKTQLGIDTDYIREWSHGIEHSTLRNSEKSKIKISLMPEESEMYDYFLIKDLIQRNHPDVEISIASGTLSQVYETLEKSDIFIGLNKGKNPLWGEGCPRTQQEAAHFGNAIVAFDCLGNHEYLIHNYNGYLVSPNLGVNGIIKQIAALLDDMNKLNSMRSKSQEIAKQSFSGSQKVQELSQFLALSPQRNVARDIRLSTGRSIFLTDGEIEYLFECAGLAKKNIVEIGTAYGGSAIVFLLATLKFKNVKVHSVDSFQGDSEGKWKVKKSHCINNVNKSVSKFDNSKAKNWNLIPKSSVVAAKEWRNGEIDLIFIDGSHVYADVKADFSVWFPHIAIGGRILFHDSNRLDQRDFKEHYLRGWDGPTKFVNELIHNQKVKFISNCHSISEFIKITD